jgi:hypothetical protein
MQVIIAFVGFEVRGEFVVVGNVTDFIPDPTTRPPSNVPEFRGGEPERIKVVLYPRLVPYGSSIGAGNDLFRYT